VSNGGRRGGRAGGSGPGRPKSSGSEKPKPAERPKPAGEPRPSCSKRLDWFATRLYSIQECLRYPLTPAAYEARLKKDARTPPKVRQLTEEPPEKRAANKKEAVEQAEAAAKKEKEQEQAETGGKKVANYLGTLAKAVGTGLGVGGVVAVAGAAVLWNRFDVAGIPADQAVDAVPQNQLIVFGASALISAAVIGLAAAVFAFALNPLGSVTFGSILAVGLLALVGAFFAFKGDPNLSVGTECILVVLAVALALGSLGVAENSGTSFLPFGVAIFFAALIFTGALAFAQTGAERKIQPAAIVDRCQGIRAHGFYVSDDDDHVWLAIRAKPRDDQEDLERFDRTPTTRLRVGPAVKVGQANKKAARIQRNLVREDSRALIKLRRLRQDLGAKTAEIAAVICPAAPSDDESTASGDEKAGGGTDTSGDAAGKAGTTTTG
jgi:hypothetical protein